MWKETEKEQVLLWKVTVYGLDPTKFNCNLLSTFYWIYLNSVKDKDYSAFPALQALMSALLCVGKYLNSFPYTIFIHLKSQTAQRSAFLTILCQVSRSEFSAYQKSFIGKKCCFSCFDCFVQKNIINRRWLSDDSVFLRKGRLWLFLGSFLVSGHGEILLAHGAGGSPRLDSGPHSGPQEWKRKKKRCHLLIVLLLFLSHLHSCLK